MSRNAKPRKAYRPRPVALDTMTLAIHYAAKPSKADCNEVLGILDGALKALREGVATEHQWSIVAGSVAVALTIEKQGVVRGLQGHLQAAENALQAVYNRACAAGGRYTRATLHYQELDALQTFYDLHKFQTSQLGRKEFLQAIADAEKQTLADGHTFTRIGNLRTERLAA